MQLFFIYELDLFVVNNRTYLFELPSISTMFTAELFAVHKAVYIVSLRKCNVLVCFDSISAIQALERMCSKLPIVSEILASVGELKHCKTQVSFCWIQAIQEFQTMYLQIRQLNRLFISQHSQSPTDSP